MKRSSFFSIMLLLLTGTGFAMPSYEDVRSRYTSSDAVLLDRHGEVIQELRVDPQVRRLSWTRLADISPALVNAVVRSEDKRFSEHHGADWTALASAAVRNLFTDRRRGASTITMQLASLLDEGPRSRKGKRSIQQKWEQIRAAREIEGTWTKNRILEAYLNLVSFRGELQGVAAAARGLFDKEPGGLDEAESAVLAALIRSPNAPPEKVGERAALLAASLKSASPSAEIRQLAIDRLSEAYSVRRKPDDAPLVARRLLSGGSRSAASTLDGRLQRFALEALVQALGGLQDRNVRDGAVLVADNRSGDVLAYVANAGSASSAPFVDGIRARRQAGSTLKPFLYARAIEDRILTAASLLEDAPLDVPTGRGMYRPENYDHGYRGWVTVRTALASSLNVPAVRAIDLLGGESLAGTLRDFGFAGLAPAEHYGPSLALGSADVTLWELVNAYRTLANGGLWSGLRLSPRERTGARRRVLSRNTTFIISDMLADREARSATFSLESPLATRFWTAVKTGTSKDMRDNWCVGYSDRYAVGVWVGNFSGASMWDVSGISGAAPVWLEVMKYLHGERSSAAPAPPEGIVARTRITNGGRADTAKKEWFIAGTEHNAPLSRSRLLRPRILYPAADMVIAIDPDIPEDRQRMFFRSSAAAGWVLDGRELGTSSLVSWNPVPGRHELRIIGPDAVVADRLGFEVR